MSFRTTLILINLVAIGGLLAFIAYRVVSLRRNPEPQEPENLTEFFADDVLEGPHLERVLGVSLVALVVSVVALVGYFLWEPFRAADATSAFEDRSVERGEVLFAGRTSPAFDSAKSLDCARCHGDEGQGGSALQLIKSTDPRCDLTQTVDEALAESAPYCLPQQVSWVAPNLTLAPLRYSRAQLTQIITFGRPGTPMPAWGVKSGKGALNEQSIQDLVNYLYSIDTTPDKAQAAAVKDAAATRELLASDEVRAAAAKWVADSAAGLAEAQAELAALPSDATPEQRSAANGVVELAREQAAVALAWQQTTQSATDGEVLFMNNCARCHTRGWSYFDPSDPQANPALGAMGGGAFGPNLRDGDVDQQFPSPLYDADFFGWISAGVPAFEAYGVRGISSGRMPHFGAVLTKEQIEAIMDYERSLQVTPMSVTLASEVLHKGLWYPTILGVLVVVAGIALFCGSIYVLLGTNLGARLGFLVAFTGLTGFMVILSLLWTTTSSPLNTIKGRIPQWTVQEVVKSPEDSTIDAVHGIQKRANRVDATEAANVKAAVDAELVPKEATPTEPLGPDDNQFAIDAFSDVTKYKILNTFEVGGSNPQFWKFQFTHDPLYAAAQFCEVQQPPPDRPPELPPIPPECDPNGETGFVVLQRDLGSLRVPPFVAFCAFTILFLLGLLMLHWREKDEMEAEAAKQERQQPESRPTRVPEKV